MELSEKMRFRCRRLVSASFLTQGGVFDLALVKMLYCARSDTVQFGLEVILVCTHLGDQALERDFQ